MWFMLHLCVAVNFLYLSGSVFLIFTIITGITMFWHDMTFKTCSCICRNNGYNPVQQGVAPSFPCFVTWNCNSTCRVFRFSWILFRHKSSTASVIETFEIFTYALAPLNGILLHAFTFTGGSIFIISRRATRRGSGGEVSPALSRKLEKSALIWRKMPWLWSFG